MGCASSSEAVASCIPEQYSFKEKLGQGSFAQVWLCSQRNAKTECAIKIVESGSKLARARNHHEGSLWELVTGHRHVVNLLDKGCGYFVMERCAHSLDSVFSFKAGHFFQEDHLLATFQEMLLALHHCHSAKVVHRDVKPANFLVGFDGAVKLCDFGLAELEAEHGLVGRAGTAAFLSPEMVLGQRYNHKTDIWSLGVTAYLMLYGDYPHRVRKSDRQDGETLLSKEQLMHHAIATNSPQPRYEEEKGFHKPSPEAREFVQALLSRDPSVRPSANECLHMNPLPAKLKKDKVMNLQKHRDIGQGGSQNLWTLPDEKNDENLYTLSGDKIDGSQDIVNPILDAADVVEVIDQLPLRLPSRPKHSGENLGTLSRQCTASQSSIGSSSANKATTSRDFTASQSLTGSASTNQATFSKTRTAFQSSIGSESTNQATFSKTRTVSQSSFESTSTAATRSCFDNSREI